MSTSVAHVNNCAYRPAFPQLITSSRRRCLGWPGVPSIIKCKYEFGSYESCRYHDPRNTRLQDSVTRLTMARLNDELNAGMEIGEDQRATSLGSADSLGYDEEGPLRQGRDERETSAEGQEIENSQTHSEDVINGQYTHHGHIKYSNILTVDKAFIARESEEIDSEDAESNPDISASILNQKLSSVNGVTMKDRESPPRGILLRAAQAVLQTISPRRARISQVESVEPPVGFASQTPSHITAQPKSATGSKLRRPTPAYPELDTPKDGASNASGDRGRLDIYEFSGVDDAPVISVGKKEVNPARKRGRPRKTPFPEPKSAQNNGEEAPARAVRKRTRTQGLVTEEGADEVETGDPVRVSTRSMKRKIDRASRRSPSTHLANSESSQHALGDTREVSEPIVTVDEPRRLSKRSKRAKTGSAGVAKKVQKLIKDVVGQENNDEDISFRGNPSQSERVSINEEFLKLPNGRRNTRSAHRGTQEGEGHDDEHVQADEEHIGDDEYQSDPDNELEDSSEVDDAISVVHSTDLPRAMVKIMRDVGRNKNGEVLGSVKPKTTRGKAMFEISTRLLNHYQDLKMANESAMKQIRKEIGADIGHLLDAVTGTLRSEREKPASRLKVCLTA